MGKGAELDEVLQLTQKVSYRVKKLVRLARQAHESRDTEPVKELEWFAREVKNYLEDVKKEREANQAKLESLKDKKKQLEARLTSLGGGFVKSETMSAQKRASIVRNATRIFERPPNQDGGD